MSSTYAIDTVKMILNMYIDNLLKMKIRHPNYDSLLKLKSDLRSDKVNVEDYLMDDLLVLTLLSLTEKHCTFSESIASLNMKVKRVLDNKSKKIVKGSKENIMDIVCLYTRPSPRKVIKNTGDEQLSPQMRRMSLSRGISSNYNSPTNSPTMIRDVSISSYSSNETPGREYSRAQIGSPVMNY